MSDEDDYMSDKFLSESVINDIRPGLLRSHSDRRNFQALKRKREFDEQNRKKNTNIKVLESEKRREGLEKPLEQSNKGFALLQKMGYKPGSSIGKSENGRIEPIPIELKSNREGLGKSQLRKENLMKKIQEKSLNTVSTSEYRSRITEQNLIRQTEIDLRKSQKTCENLDIQNNILEPMEKWYWPSMDINDETESNLKSSRKRKLKEKKFGLSTCMDEDEFNYTDDSQNSSEDDISNDDDEHCENENSDTHQISDEEKLTYITSYLRERYFYCIWCSVKYNDDTDMSENCPGDTLQYH